MIETEAIVIGAGAVGLACGAALARTGKETLVLESALGIGTGTSARNSEVIHAGLYYPTGSLRHQLCVAGRRRLYQWLAERGVPHRKTGKLIVGTTDAQIPRMQALFSVLKAPDIPSALVELGFLSSQVDRDRLLDPDWRARAAAGLRGALLDWQAADAARSELLRR